MEPLEVSVKRITDMLGWRLFEEEVVMRERRFGYFPSDFVWRGRPFKVTGVSRCWTRSRRGWRGPGRHFFQVYCAEGDFELYQDTHTTNWYLRRARLDCDLGHAAAAQGQRSALVYS